MSSKQEVTERFALWDEDGKRYDAVEITNYTVFRPLKGLPQLMPGAREYRLVNGTDLNEIESGRVYAIWDTGARLRRS